jgi:hypothetical protein
MIALSAIVIGLVVNQIVFTTPPTPDEGAFLAGAVRRAIVVSRRLVTDNTYGIPLVVSRNSQFIPV